MHCVLMEHQCSINLKAQRHFHRLGRRDCMKPQPLLIACTVLALPMAHTSLAQDRPNIVLILSDDQAWYGTSVQMHPDLPNSRSDFFPDAEAGRTGRSGYAIYGRLLSFASLLADPGQYSERHESCEKTTSPRQRLWRRRRITFPLSRSFAPSRRKSKRPTSPSANSCRKLATVPPTMASGTWARKDLKQTATTKATATRATNLPSTGATRKTPWTCTACRRERSTS